MKEQAITHNQMTQRSTCFASSQVIFRRDGKILLMRRCNTGYLDGMYGLAAGHIDSGETAIQAAIREAAEETDIQLNENDLVPTHTSHRLSEQSRTYFDIYFEVERWEGEPKIAEPEKCDALLWTAIENFPENTVPHVRYTLAAIARGERYSEFGW